MGGILADFSMASTVHAVEANLFAFFEQLKTWPRVEVHDAGECIFTLSDLPYPLFNSVMRARVPDDRLDALIATRMQSCRDRQVPMLWWTGPSTQPAYLADRLDAAGFVVEPAFGMIADLQGEPSRLEPSRLEPPRLEPSRLEPPRLEPLCIERVSSRSSLVTWSRVLCEGFGAPASFGDAFAQMAEAIGLDKDSPFRHYLAQLGGEPVATCSLFLGAGVAGIYDVSTVPGCRRAGIGAAITNRAMDDAHEAGYRMAILHASQLGVSMYRSLGFETICDIGQHVWGPEF